MTTTQSLSPCNPAEQPPPHQDDDHLHPHPTQHADNPTSNSIAHANQFAATPFSYTVPSTVPPSARPPRILQSRPTNTPAATEVFTPTFAALPALPSDAVLNYDDPRTMEHALKQAVIRSAYTTKSNSSSSATVTAADGNGHDDSASVTAATGASGMGGVGKTVALIGLATHADIRTTFPHGVYLLTIGQDASAASIVRQLSATIVTTGGQKFSRRVARAADLSRAVALTARWFSNTRTLFLLDDVWEKPGNPAGFMPVLRRLLDSSPHARLALSTRSQAVADTAGTLVPFAPREPHGTTSTAIFLRYASIPMSDMSPEPKSIKQALSEILTLCAGLPLTLGVAGRAVRTLTRALGKWQLALQRYLAEQRAAPSMSDRVLGAYSNFRQTVLVSLKLADDWWAATFSPAYGTLVRPSCSELFARLCVLPSHARVRYSLFMRIWPTIHPADAVRLVDKLVDLNLVTPQAGVQAELRLGLHDLVLDFCRRRRGDDEADSRFVQSCHRSLLHHFRRFHDNGQQFVSEEGLDMFWDMGAVETATFPWWGIEQRDDGDYLLSNLARHLVESCNRTELVATLTRAEWTSRRLLFGGLPAMLSDFDILLSPLHSLQHPADLHQSHALPESISAQMLEQTTDDLMSLRTSVRLLWAYVAPDHAQLATQAHARLQDVPQAGPLVSRYLSSASRLAPTPWIRPMHRCYPLPFRGAEYVVPLPSPMWQCAVNWPCNSAAIAGGSRVTWYNIKRRTVTLSKTVLKKQNALEGVMNLALSSDAQFAVTGSEWGDVHVWDRSTVKKTLPGSEAKVWAVAISPDDKLCASGHEGGAVCVWDVRSGAILAERNEEDGDSFVQIRSLTFSPDGEVLLVAGRDKKLHLLQARSLQPVDGGPFIGHTNCVLCAAFRPDGVRIASGSDDGTLRIWDMPTRQQTLNKPVEDFPGNVRCVAYSADGRRVLTGGSDKTVRVWDAETGLPICHALHGHVDEVLSVLPHTDGNQVLSASGGDNTLRMWSLNAVVGAARGAKEVDFMHGHGQRVFYTSCRKDGAFVAAACGDGAVRFWDVRLRRVVDDMGVKATEWQPLRRVAYSDDGAVVAFGTEYGGSVGVMDVNTGEHLLYLYDLHGPDSVVHAVAISADGRWVASGSTGKVFIADMHTGTVVGNGGEPLCSQGGQIRCIRFFGTGRQFVSGSSDGSLCMWGDDGASLLLNGGECGGSAGEGGVYCMTFSPDFRFLVVGCESGAFYVWDFDKFEVVTGPFVAHENAMRAVCVSADGVLLLTAGYDTKLTLWRWDSGMGGKRTGKREHSVCKIGQVTLPSYAESAAFVGEFCDGRLYEVVVGLSNGVGVRFNIVL